MSGQKYQASQITVLEGLEAVRKRPGMYIGNTGEDGLHRCLGEILDNAVDEFMAGFASRIAVVLDKENTRVLVCDNGRGIPVDVHPKTGKTALETIMTILHAGGKFDQNSYKFSGGLHGVGASVVNALSSVLEVWVLREEKVHFLSFRQGKTQGEMQILSLTSFAEKFPEIHQHAVWQTSGTAVRFQPDETIFETQRFDSQKIEQMLKQTAYLNKGLQIDFYMLDQSQTPKDLQNYQAEWLAELSVDNLNLLAKEI